MADRLRLQWSDGVQLLLGLAAGWLGAFLLAWLLLPPLLAGPMVEELSLRVGERVVLAEQVLPLRAQDRVGLPRVLLYEGRAAPPGSHPADRGFDRRLQQDLRSHHQLERLLRRDHRPAWDPQAGYWVRLNTPGAQPMWLHVPSRIGSSSLLWPLVLTATALIGTPIGLLLALQRQLMQPLNALLRHLPEHPGSMVELVPETGLTPLRLVSRRINRLLDQLNTNAASRHQLLRGLVHDLRGPLTRLGLRLENLESSPEAQSQMAGLRADLQDLNRLGEQLAALASEETLQQGPQDLALDDVCSRIAGAYPAGAIALQVPRLLVRLHADLLQRSLNNLIDNALEYGKPPVQISAERLAHALVIRVEDHGSGLISANLLGRQPLPRADDRQRSQHHGLGLAIVERFCRDHGGRLQLDTSSLGGLKAELLLPLACLKYGGPERRRRPWRRRSEGDTADSSAGYSGPDRRGSLWGKRFGDGPGDDAPGDEAPTTNASTNTPTNTSINELP